MTRPLPPELEFETPLCPICDERTDADADAFWCNSCEVNWDRSGQRPEWADESKPQCDSTTWNCWSKKTHRCILAAGHERDLHGDGEQIAWRTDRAVPTPVDKPVDLMAALQQSIRKARP